MGVPKFYRWISERYPKINQIISDTALLPEFDHLYLDMNGIIHGCTHPPDLDAVSQQALTERDMMMGIMHYLDRIITQIVKPKVSVYMAIDGVAPRAKLNQQRSRRYRSARDMAESLKEQQERNNKNKDGSSSSNSTTAPTAFDSNCITPGTEFLAKVSELIRFFVRTKLRDDPVWRNLTVIFSGHDIPGEGEHKIMNHIRHMKEQPHYQPNTRHVMYGQDADLILLGLVTHEPHFTILREVVNFQSFKRHDAKNSLQQVQKFTKESDFQLLHLSVLREYLAIDFCFVGAAPNASTVEDEKEDETNPRTTAPQTFDLERCIDDFVFMTFLVGNDFLPHLPTLDIGDGAFDMLFSIYKDQRRSWGQGEYLTDRGEIAKASRLQAFVAAIGALETDILVQRKKDEAAYIKKKRKWDKRDGKPQGPSDAELQAMEEEKQMDYQTMVDKVLDQYGGNPDNFVEGWKRLLSRGSSMGGTSSDDDDSNNNNGTEEDGTPTTTQQEEDVKARYYYEKLHLKPIDKDKHYQLRKSYMEGLMWCLAYYYKGCVSWGWYYPYHYGPMLSDLVDIPQMFDQISFELGKPLSPFEQLMACLPPGSVTLVPKLYQWLMTSPQSPIIHFYPEQFEIDMNGKKNPWEGVNLLPFIDVAVLKDTIVQHCPPNLLSVKERQRNIFGKVYAYRYDESYTNETVPVPIPNIGMVDLVAACSVGTVLDEPETPTRSFEPRLVAGTQIPYPGFPSLNVLPIASVDFVAIGLNCFGTASKYASCVLSLERMAEPAPLDILSKAVLGKSLFVNWPMMHEAKAVAISDAKQEIRLVKGGQLRTKAHNEAAAEKWQTEREIMQQMYHVGDGIPGSGGVNIGEVRIRLKVLPLQGMKTNSANGSTKKVFGREEADVPLQLALGQAPAADPRFMERGPLTLKDRFPLNCRVVLTKGKYRGCSGQVVGYVDKKRVGVKVQTIPVEPPFGLAVARAVQESFVSSNDAARILKIHPGILGKIAGRLPFEQERYDLGLNLKSGDGMCVVGYTRKKVLDNNANNHTNNKKSSWSVGDALRVIGSTSAPANGTEDRIIWEYSPKAIRLIEAYRAKFPQLFQGISQQPNEKKYDAKVVFGGKSGEEWLPVIREWLNNLDSAKLPRTPVTTQSMSHDAVAAVQKAAAVRTLALQKKGFPKESFVKIPGAALYRQGSTSSTDILLASDLNHGEDESPQLGDRVINLAAEGIPFGMRGTIVAIHEASSTTGSVEVVMDEEFMGGSTLQGLCSKFRGKLCLWSRLLKVVPEDAKSMVDKMVPKGASRKGTVVVDRILNTLDPTAGKPNTATPASTHPPSASAASATSSINAAAPNTRTNKKSQTPQAQQPVVLLSNNKSSPAPSKTTPASTPQGAWAANPASATTPLVLTPAGNATSSSTSRDGSSQKGRQAGWREAKGPEDGGSHGFKWKTKGRKGNKGILKWKHAVNEHRKQEAAELLKSQLGIGKDEDKNSRGGVGDVVSSSSVDSAAQQLKVVLGVSAGGQQEQAASSSVVHPTTTTTSVTAVRDLKSMLGVTPASAGSSNNNTMPQPPQPAVPIPQPPMQPMAASNTEQLKVVLGVGSSPPPPPPQPVLEKPVLETAADKLLQMMVNAQQPPGPMMGGPPAVVVPPPPHYPPNPSGFNFTFTPQDEHNANNAMHPPPPPPPSMMVPPPPTTGGLYPPHPLPGSMPPMTAMAHPYPSPALVAMPIVVVPPAPAAAVPMSHDSGDDSEPLTEPDKTS